MAKVSLNTALTALGGTIDNWVYRKNGDGFIVTKRYAPAGPPTEAQLAIREQFRAAAAYAKAILADARHGPRYKAAAKAAGQRPLAFAIADYFKPPVVRDIVTSAYHGAVGNPLDVRAHDDFEVVGVTVTIRDAANAVLEQGPAGLVNDLWRYTATTAIAAGTAVTIEAVATDRPGNTGTLSVSLVVA